MNIPWDQAKGHLEKLDYPSLGYCGNWDEWYEQAWHHLESAGLTKVEKPLDLTIVNLRIAALCWLAHDFCASVEGDEWATVPCWSEWISELELDPVVAALLLQSCGQADSLLSDAILTDPELLTFDEECVWLWEVDGMSRKLWPQVVMNAAYQQRGGIIDALFTGFDGLIPLFESMFACTGECLISLASAERMRGYQWIEECCRLVIAGDPQVDLTGFYAEGSNDGL